MPVTIESTALEALEAAKQDVKENLAYHRRQGRLDVARVRKNVKVLTKLIPILPVEAELRLTCSWHWKCPRVNFERALLPKLHTAVGRLHVESKELADADKRLVGITLSAERFPGVRFYYERPLAEGSSCKIVEQTSTYKTLVCSLEGQS